jgi:hypothetical protein
MANYPKITGNSIASFDLLDKDANYPGGSINNDLNAGIYHHVFTHTTDGHTEAYMIFIIKNTVAVEEAETFLHITDISVQVSSSTFSWFGSSIWSSDGTTLFHDSNEAIELDYMAKHTDGSDLTAPFVGIQDESNGSVGSGGIATHVLADASTYTGITTEDYFLKFKVVDNAGEGEVTLVASDSEDFDFITPIHNAHRLCADTAGIPNGCYATIVARVAVDDLAAFDHQHYGLNIGHDGETASGNSNNIIIPITLSMTNEMSTRILVGSDVVVSNNNTATYGNHLINNMNFMDSRYVGDDGGSYEAVLGVPPSATTTFENEGDAELYINSDEQTLSYYADTRTAFKTNFRWQEISPVPDDKTLTLEITSHEDLDLFSAANNLQAHAGFTEVAYDKQSNEHEGSFVQTPLSSGISTTGTFDSTLGCYKNFNYSTYSSAVQLKYIAVDSNSAVKTTTASVVAINYPLFTVPNVTANKAVSADGLSGNIVGVNHSGWSVASNLSADALIHTTATSGNTDFLFLQNRNGLGAHHVPLNAFNYIAPDSSFAEWDSIRVMKSSFDINVRINSLNSRYDVVYNGITSWDAGTNAFKGLGFAKLNCEVEQTVYASSGETIETLTYPGANTTGDGANDQVTSAISGLAGNYRDYSIKLVTSGARNAGLSYNKGYADQITGIGAEKYTSKISLPTGIVNYGYGEVPNHYQHATTLSFNTLFYPSLPSLEVAVFNDYEQDGGSATVENRISPTGYNRWQKLNVAADTTTSPETAASTRYLASDGLFDWAKLSENSSLTGTYKMPSTANVTFTTSNNEVVWVPWNVAAVQEAVTLGDGIIVLDDGEEDQIQKGMRLIAQSGSALQDTTNTTTFEDNIYVIAGIGAPAGGKIALTMRKEDGTADGAAPALPAIASGKDLIFVDDWIQPGMMVEALELENTDKGYYIEAMTYIGGSADGDKYYSFADKTGTPINEARTNASASTGVKITLKYKDDNTNAVPSVANSTDTGFTGVFKPWATFASVNAGINHHYVIHNTELSDCLPGETVKITEGSEHTSYGSANNDVGQEYVVTGSAGVHPTSNSTTKVDLIVRNPNEFGVKNADGSLLSSKKNIGLPSQGEHASYVAFNSKKLNCYDMSATSLADGVYTKEFTVKFVNGGEEDLYLHSAEFVDAGFIPNTGGNTSASPVDSSGVAWTVSPMSATPDDATTLIGVGNSTYQYDRPSVLLENHDKRVRAWSADSESAVQGITEIPNTPLNVIGCRFVCNAVSSTGSYFKYLKVGYYRDTGRTKYQNISDVPAERYFKNKEVWYAHIPVSVHLDSQASISLSDADGDTLSHMGGVTIGGLLG